MLRSRPARSISRPNAHRVSAALLAATTLVVVALGCGDPVPILTILSPASGTFTTGSSITMTGTVTNIPVADLALTVNGTPVPLQPDGSFSTTLAVSQSAVLNPFVVKARKVSLNYTVTQRVMVIAGPAVVDGMFSPSGIGMRINDTGLNQLEPTIQSMINGSFDISSMILAANPIVDDYCVIDTWFGCAGRVDVNASSVTYSQPVGVNLDAITNLTNVLVAVQNIRINYRVTGAVSCDGHLTASTTNVSGNYDQVPGVPANNVNVNQQGDVGVGFVNFNNSFDSGVCDWPIIGDIIQLVIGDVQPMVHDGLGTNLRDPDGSGPQDAPIAAAIQATLAGLSIAGPIGTALGVTLNADLENIAEDTTGLTYRTASRVTQPDPTPGSPDQLYSSNPAETFPTLGANTPVTNQPYGLGLAISSGTFNQLLKAETESGLLQLDVTEFQGVPLTASLLALFLPEFSNLPGSTPLVLRVKPTLAPFLTGQDGPGGEISDLRVPQVIGTVLGHDSFANEVEYLKVAFDARIGLNFSFDNQTASLTPTFGTILPADITVSVLSYLSGSINISASSEATLQGFLPQILALALPELGSALGSFPMPSFLGLQLQLVELRKVNNYLGLFVNLAP